MGACASQNQTIAGPERKIKQTSLLDTLYAFDEQEVILYDLVEKTRQKIKFRGDIGSYNASIHCMNGRVFVTGGEQWGTIFKATYEFKNNEVVESEALVPRAEMNIERQGHCMAASGSDIYVIGGDKSEVYIGDEDSWKKYPDLSNKHINSRAAIVSDKHLYVFAGKSLKLTDIERLNITMSTNGWTQLEIDQIDGANTSHNFGAFAISDTEILLFGGIDDQNNYQSSSYIFNTDSSSFNQISDLPSAASFLNSSTILLKNQKVHAIGVDPDNNTSVFCYDIIQKQWSKEDEKKYSIIGHMSPKNASGKSIKINQNIEIQPFNDSLNQDLQNSTDKELQKMIDDGEVI